MCGYIRCCINQIFFFFWNCLWEDLIGDFWGWGFLKIVREVIVGFVVVGG